MVTTAARVAPGQPVTIGWPLNGWEIAVLDAGGEPVGLGEPGELVIGGVGLGRYLDPVLDARRFAGVPSLGWERAYRTGDVVRETIAVIEFVGRRDDQVKLGGRRIELGEVDAALSAVPGVKAALTAVRESAGGNKLLVGYIVGEVDPAVVRASVARRLPGALVPLIVALESLPRGVSGKVAGQIGPQLGWGWLILGWLVFASAPGRAAIVLATRRVLLLGLKPGRYPHGGWLTCRIERLAEIAVWRA